MKSFLETSKHIRSITEGFFDLADDKAIDSQINKDVNADFLSKCKGNYTIVTFKDGTIRINGKLLISKIDNEDLSLLNCRDFHGKLFIENCPNLKTLEGSFLSKIAVFDGSITINQCPNLESINGIPAMVKGDVMITNCKKLKDFGTLESVFGNLYWEKNGRKYTKEEIISKVSVIKKVFCSVEDEEADVVEGMVSEAFNNPWLSKLAKQLKKYPFSEWSWRNTEGEQKVAKVSDIFKYSKDGSYYGRLLDKISFDDIDVYDMGNKKDKDTLAKEFYNIYSARTTRGDLILIFDENTDEFVGAFGDTTAQRGVQGEGVSFITIPNSKGNVREPRNIFYGKLEAKAKLMSYGTGYTIIVIKAEKDSESRSELRGKLRQQRQESQKGVINPGDVEQYREIAAANLKRYKQIVAMNRANKKTEEYEKINDAVERIMMRVFKLTRDVTKDPKKYDKYDITNFLNWVRNERQYGNHGAYGENGLIYYFKTYMDRYMNVFGKRYSGAPDEGDVKSLEQASNTLNVAINKADNELKKWGF